MDIRTPQNSREWAQYYDLRYHVLRAPWQQPLGSERNEMDALALHFACFEQDRICGVVRLDTYENETQAQVRFMAVDPDFQGQGIGKKLMREAEQKARQLGYKTMMLHARENALHFYESLNYKITAQSYLLFDAIQHYRMEKNLNT